MKKLSIRQRTVFTLRHYEDMSLEEIGNLLGLDVVNRGRRTCSGR